MQKRLPVMSVAALLAVAVACLAQPIAATQQSTPPVRYAAATRPLKVKLGIDVLAEQKFKPLQGKRVALITNHTGLDSQGRRVVDVMHQAEGVKLTKLFSPEHGLYGRKDEKVGDEVDEKTGLHVFSLYGKTRKPTAEMLKDVDIVVFDIQDIGARYYTYISTMGLAMEAAKENKIEAMVLDRPNPITGILVDGPIADEQHLGFTAFRPMPVAHGMTVCELAEMFNKEFGIGCKLTTVKMSGWRRDMWWDETGVKWVNPSPNMKTPTGALLYLAVGLLEASNVSVGRGTEIPFEIFGARWTNSAELAGALNGLGLPGLRFVEHPFDAVYDYDPQRGYQCGGVRVLVTDRDKVRPVEAGVAMAITLRKLYPNRFRVEKVANMLQNDSISGVVLKMDVPQQASSVWTDDVERFKAVRAKYLIYP